MTVNDQSAKDNTAGNRNPAILHRKDWASHEHLWKGFLQGKDIGTTVTVLFYVATELGAGPRWHVHPYDEIFIVREGNA